MPLGGIGKQTLTYLRKQPPTVVKQHSPYFNICSTAIPCSSLSGLLHSVSWLFLGPCDYNTHFTWINHGWRLQFEYRGLQSFLSSIRKMCYKIFPIFRELITKCIIHLNWKIWALSKYIFYTRDRSDLLLWWPKTTLFLWILLNSRYFARALYILIFCRLKQYLKQAENITETSVHRFFSESIYFRITCKWLQAFHW